MQQDIPYDFHKTSALDISLLSSVKTENRTIEGVVISGKKKYKNKKENPAYAILNEVWKRKYSNAFDSYDNYKYDEYQKLEASLNNLDSTFTQKKIFRGVEFMFKNVDTASTTGKAFVPIYINEQLATFYKRNKPSVKEKEFYLQKKLLVLKITSLWYKPSKTCTKTLIFTIIPLIFSIKVLPARSLRMDSVCMNMN